MKSFRKPISNITIAALVLMSAAVFAGAQSKGSEGSKTREEQEPVPPAQKQNSRTNDRTQNGQTPAAAGNTGDAQTVQASYSYEFKQPEFFISHVLIEHDASGRGKITFERKNTDPIVDPVQLSPAALTRIKALWTALGFIDSDRDYQTERQYPHLGTMWLRMSSGGKSRTTSFNYTADKDAFALVNEYKRIANQTIFLFDITVARENQPLEAPKLMEQLESYYKRNDLSDPEQLVPLLRDLSVDERIPLMARNSALRLLQKIGQMKNAK